MKEWMLRGDEEKIMKGTIPHFLAFRCLQQRVKLVAQIESEMGKDAYQNTYLEREKEAREANDQNSMSMLWEVRWSGPADDPKQERLWLMQGFLSGSEDQRKRWDEATFDLAQINETVQEDIAHWLIKDDLRNLSVESKKVWTKYKNEENEKEKSAELGFRQE